MMAKRKTQQTAVATSASPIQMKPVAAAVHRALHSKGRAPLVAATLLTSSAALAQGSAVLEEIVVTAQKRAENLQDVPIAVTAFGNTKIQQLGIQSFADFAMMVPNLSYKTTSYQGPTIVMRGAADGGDGNPSGQSPSVAVYLDEQPVSFAGGQLDIYVYDMERIEALAGPQGTLFGASSQTGTVRYITNKPNVEAFEAGFDLQARGTQDGDPGGSAEGFINFPIGTNGALRLTGWYVEEGGWIDNVPSSAAFGRGEDSPAHNPSQVQQLTPGQYEYVIATGGVPQTVILTPDAFAEDDQNELTKQGFRAALGINLTDNWTLTLGVNYSDTETEGVWEHSPSQVGEGNVQRYSEDSWDEEWTQFNLTVEGEFANHQLVYAGAFMDRETDYNQGYNAYGEYSGFMSGVNGYNGYACDYSGTFAPCTTLIQQGAYPFDQQRQSHELRLVSLADSRLHYTVGLFTETLESDFRLDFVQPGMTPEYSADFDPRGLHFRTAQDRENTQFAVFGELTYDFTDSVSGTVGARWFDEEETLTGVVGYGTDAGPGFDTPVDSKFTNDDQIFKLNVTWRVTDDALLYATWSEGYRPGGVNREASFQDTVLETYIPDLMTNYEIGWKTQWMDGQLRFNGAAYLMEWDDVQYTIYEFAVSKCCGNTYNLETAEILGAEFDLSWAVTERWTLSLAGAYNDAETTADFILPDVGFSDRFQVPDGTPLPNVPEFKANAIIRYDF
ncbi:MAG: TonB-dependent receptor, partial [Gammaproteobacteria bacterium]